MERLRALHCWRHPIPTPLPSTHLLPKHRQPFLQGQLEPVSNRGAVAGLMVEKLVRDGACTAWQRMRCGAPAYRGGATVRVRLLPSPFQVHSASTFLHSRSTF